MTLPDLKKHRTSQRDKTKWILNFFENTSPTIQFPGGWRNERDEAAGRFQDLDYWIQIAKLAEKAKIHSIFIGDTLGGFDVYKGPQNIGPVAKGAAMFPKLSPTEYISAMAAVTESVGFSVTASTINEHPYLFTRRLASLDHLSNGRVGWNIVTSFLPSAARNLVEGGKLPDHDERYEKSEEYLKVVSELLLSSWRDDALVNDAEKEVWIETDRLRTIDFEGKYFIVPGPGLTEPTKQRIPYILQAGTSAKGKLFAAKFAETVFVNALTPQALAEQVRSIKKIAIEKYGRDPNSIKFVTLVTTILGKTHEEAQAKYDEIKQYADLEAAQALFGGWTGIDLDEYEWDQELQYVESNHVRSYLENLVKNNVEFKFTRKTIAEKIAIGGIGTGVLVGTAKEVADQLQSIYEIGDIDGFNFTYAVWPETFEDVVELLIPELQKRGVAQTEYAVPGGTLRENVAFKKGQNFVPTDHPLYKYRWTNDLSKEEFEAQFKIVKESDVPI